MTGSLAWMHCTYLSNSISFLKRIEAACLINTVELKCIKESSCNLEDPGSILKSGRSPGEGNGNPLQYSCLGNPMDRRTWWAIVHGVPKSQTELRGWHFSLHEQAQGTSLYCAGWALWGLQGRIQLLSLVFRSHWESETSWGKWVGWAEMNTGHEKRGHPPQWLESTLMPPLHLWFSSLQKGMLITGPGSADC